MARRRLFMGCILGFALVAQWFAHADVMKGEVDQCEAVQKAGCADPAAPTVSSRPVDDSILFQKSMRYSAGLHRKSGTLCAVQGTRCFDFSPQSTAMHTPPSGFVQLVVARYREDIRWLDALAELPTIVYNRGDDDELLPRGRPNLQVHKQANTGREDEVFLRHILTNYDEGLANTTIFLQGWPFLHCPGVLDAVRAAAAAGPEAGSASLLMPISRTFYKYSLLEGKLGYELSAADANGRQIYQDVCEQILGRPCPETSWVAEGAQWAVSRERILSRPKSLYERALAIPEGYHAKLRGLVLEALWPTLWAAIGWTPQAANVTDGESGTSILQVASKPSDALDLNKVVMATIRAQESHCSTPEPNAGLLWSCVDRMGACELEWRMSRAEAPVSVQFAVQRHRFFKPAEAPSPVWGMLAQLEAPLLPGPPLLVEVRGDRLWLGPSNEVQAAHWHVMEAHEGPDNYFIFEHRQAGSGPAQYLGCNASTGLSQVGPRKTPWSVQLVSDGFVVMVSGDRRLQLLSDAAGPWLRDNWLHCVPSMDDAEPYQAQFAVQMLKQT